MDARLDPDAPVGLDASADARPPCVGGDAQVVDPMTGACYLAFRTLRTRAEAQTACVALGATLANAKTADANLRLTNLVGAAEAFLGGTDRMTEGTFVWSDGSALTYANWRKNPPPQIGEPNNGNGMFQEDCIVIQGQLAGVWDDKPCDSSEVATAGKYQYICQR